VSLTFTFPYVNTPAFYTGTSSSALVPDIFPVAINGRPYIIDQRSNQFTRAFEQRVRDSVDQSTAPGEAAINPGGLWRRGEVSWHLGAGQKYADTAEGQDYRFFKSKGVNPWAKGQLTLLNSTKATASLSSANTNLQMVEINGYVYVADGQTLKYTTDPYAATPTWTSVTTDAPAAAINDITTDGVRVYVAYANNSIYITTPGTSSVTKHFLSSTNVNFTSLGFAKGFVMAYHPDTDVSHVHIVPFVASNSKTPTAELRDPNFVSAGFAGGQNHIYLAGRSSDNGVVYKLGIKADGTVDVAVVALELPIGEFPTSIHGYLGAIILGTNKGVRYTTPDSNGNLVSGALIPTSGSVNDFTAADRFVWFTWSNYDGVSGGLGRLDLSTFIAANTPAHASDLMYGSSADIKSTVTLAGKRIFTVSGVGVVVEDSANLVVSGEIESGIYRWGIPDRKFIARVDTRSTPLVGTISSFMSLDAEEYVLLGVWSGGNDTENSFNGSDNHAIEAQFKFVLGRGTATTGPTFTRWTARAYAAPYRSEVFRIPVILHEQIRVHENDYFFDVNEELGELRELINKPRIVTLQVREETVSVIVEDLEWTPVDSVDKDWLWQGTATVTMRSVQE
jgi:hypothetical protein